MSTNVSVKPKPPKASLGTIKSISPFTPSKTPGSIYHVAAFEIQPDNDPEGRAVKGWLVLHPQMLSSRFLSHIRVTRDTPPDAAKESKSLQFVYDNNVGFKLGDGDKLIHAHPAQGDETHKPRPWYGKSAIPTLAGLFGTDLAAIDELTNDFGSREEIGEEILAELDAALATCVGKRVGYWETQDVKKLDTYNERGYQDTELLNRYKFECFFHPTTKNIKKLVEMGKKSDGRCLITFDGDTAFMQGAATPF